MTMKIVTINSLYKSFRDSIALDNLSLGIEKEKIFGLFDPKGAGESIIES